MNQTSAPSPVAVPPLPGRWARLWRHLWVTDWQLRRALPPGALDHLQSTIAAGEEVHAAQVRFIVEADLDLLETLAGWGIPVAPHRRQCATLEDVKSFFDSYYTPGNAVVVVAGDFDPAQARGWIQRYFGTIPARPTPPRPGNWPP